MEVQVRSWKVFCCINWKVTQPSVGSISKNNEKYAQRWNFKVFKNHPGSVCDPDSRHYYPCNFGTISYYSHLRQTDLEHAPCFTRPLKSTSAGILWSNAQKINAPYSKCAQMWSCQRDQISGPSKRGMNKSVEWHLRVILTLFPGRGWHIWNSLISY